MRVLVRECSSVRMCAYVLLSFTVGLELIRATEFVRCRRRRRGLRVVDYDNVLSGHQLRPERERDKADRETERETVHVLRKVQTVRCIFQVHTLTGTTTVSAVSEYIELTRVGIVRNTMAFSCNLCGGRKFLKSFAATG